MHSDSTRSVAGAHDGNVNANFEVARRGRYKAAYTCALQTMVEASWLSAFGQLALGAVWGLLSAPEDTPQAAPANQPLGPADLAGMHGSAI
jgi:hypothetical protein